MEGWSLSFSFTIVNKIGRGCYIFVCLRSQEYILRIDNIIMITIDNNDWCMGPLSSGHHYGVGPTGDDC